jgi:hypothetical protein
MIANKIRIGIANRSTTPKTGTIMTKAMQAKVAIQTHHRM